MIEDFIFHNDTKIIFGKNSLNSLVSKLKNYGKNILLAYGKGAIKNNGIYDLVINELKKANKNIFEFSGIMPNPTYEKVLEGANLIKKHNIDFILAVGGGSTIDCVKAVAVVGAGQQNAWEHCFIKNLPLEVEPIKIGAVLTMCGTGSEMNGNAVITNEETNIKTALKYAEVRPKFSILNPEFTYAVPRKQMVSGIYDILQHLMENYFCTDDNINVSDALAEALMKSVIQNTKIALTNQQDYIARSNIMWASTLGLNSLTALSKSGDWNVHQIEHQIGAFTDCPHGLGLASIAPNYYRTIFRHAIPRFKQFAINVFNVNPENKSDELIALEGIDALEKFIKDSEMHYTLTELGVKDDMIEKIISTCNIIPTSYYTLTRNDIKNIILKSM